MLNLKIYAILGAIIIGLGYGFKVYYDYAQAERDILNANLQKAQIEIESAKKTFEEYRETITAQQEALKELNKQLTDVEIKTSKLSKTLARHELDRLAGEKPGLIKIKANKATKKVFENLEKLSQPVEEKK